MRPTILSTWLAAALLLGFVPAAQATSWPDPGDDWAAMVVRSIFPATVNSGDSSIGPMQTVIGTMLGELTGFIMILAGAFVAYATIIQIHRAAETGRVLSRSMSSWAPVRLAFAVVMMFPLASGFSAGQAAVVQVAMWGVGMARGLYTSAIQAVGPNAVPITQPFVPGTKAIVAGLMQNELCRALVNQAAGNPSLVPPPAPVTGAASSGYVTWSYSLATGNETGQPVCGTVTVRQPRPGGIETEIAGVDVDMTPRQRSVLQYVTESVIRPQVEAVARELWQTRQAAAPAPLLTTFVTATNAYTQQLTASATFITANIRSRLAAANDLREGAVGLTAGQARLEALGWTSAAAYYLEIARLNGQTVSLLSAVPVVNPPTYAGLGTALSNDLAPLVQASMGFGEKLDTYVRTADGTNAPGGNADLFSGVTPGSDGAGVMGKVVRWLGFDEGLMAGLIQTLSPTTGAWTDPFTRMIQLGHLLIVSALSALGVASLLSSSTASGATTAFQVLTFNWTGAAATAVGHMVIDFLGTPIFFGCMALLVPGILLAFILPMIPYIMWLAGVAGWLILVCEAVVAVPLWMFAHLTLQGDGLHGRGLHGYALLFNILFRPVLMLFGLFLGYFIFTVMSWLILQGFGIAAGFVLANGWIVTNVIGVVVLLCMFVLLELTTALLSFRMISLVPHHVVRLIGLAPANRVDMDQFGSDAGVVGMGATTRALRDGAHATLGTLAGRGGGRGERVLSGPMSRPALTGPGRGTDTTLAAASDVTPPARG